MQKITTFGRNLQWRASTVFSICNFLNPTIGQHYFEITGQRGWVEVKAFANVDTPNRSDPRHNRQEIELCGFQTKCA